MKFNVAGKLGYQVLYPSTLILNIHAMRSAAQSVIQESFTIDPYYKAEEITSVNTENRYMRLEIQGPINVNISYEALVDTTYQTIEGWQLTQVPVMGLDPSILQYLSPSRYCQSDKLFRFAHSKFGYIKNAFNKVLALTDWIHANVEYLSGSTNSQTSAYDTVTELAGVCRDFAHLGITLCRALDIPARYFSGYSYLLNPPDFHACFEAYLGGHWVIFDATKLVPLNGLVKIATGRDAADTSIATIFGNVVGTWVSASCQLAEDKFELIYYGGDNYSGISYL